MSDKPAAYQLGIYISLFFIIVFGLFTYWSFSYNKDLINKNAQNNAISISSKIIGTISEKIVLVQEISANLANQVPIIGDQELLPDILDNIANRYEYITAVDIVIYNAEDGQVTYSSEQGLEPVYSGSVNQRDCSCESMLTMIERLRNSGRDGWSEPYFCPKDSDLVVMYYLPFTHDGMGESIGLEGYVACEISLNFMNRLIVQTKVGNEGFAFLISKSGTYITHPMQELVLKRNLFELPAEVFKGERHELEAFINEDFGSLTVYPDLLNHARSIVYHTKMPHTGWVLATTIPYKELNSGFNWMIKRMIIILLLAITAIFLSIFFISSRIMEPLSRVTKEIYSFSNEFQEQESQVRNEAEALTHSLKRLKKTYEKFRINEAESLKQSQRYQRDLLIASEIQRSIIPPEGKYSFQDKMIELYTVFQPANTVSGDLYDFFMIDSKHLLVTIGDVSGSGVPAALFMGVAHTFIKSSSRGNKARAIVKKVNKVLCKNNSNQFFLTLFLGILNIEEGTFNFCNAGHTPVYVLRANGKIEVLAKPHGLPLGLYAERNYEESNIHLHEHDTILLYTDGVTDQTNEAGEYFGEENLRQFIRTHKQNNPEELARKLVKQIDTFRGTSKDSDDISLLALRYNKAEKNKTPGIPVQNEAAK